MILVGFQRPHWCDNMIDDWEEDTKLYNSYLQSPKYSQTVSNSSDKLFVITQGYNTNYKALFEPQQPITYNCTYNLKYGFYYDVIDNKLPFVNKQISYFLHVFTLIFITLCYYFKLRIHTDKKERSIKLALRVVLIVFYIMVYLIEMEFPKLPFRNLIFIAFFIDNSKIIQKTSMRIYKIFVSIMELLLLEVVVFGIVAYAVKISCYEFGDIIHDSENFYTYNFSTYYSIFVSLMYMQTNNTYPDLVLPSWPNNNSYIFRLVVSVQHLVSFFVIQSVVLGYIQNKYEKIEAQDLEEQLNGRETILLALEMVDDPKNLRFNALKDLAFENLYLKEEEAKKRKRKLKMQQLKTGDESFCSMSEESGIDDSLYKSKKYASTRQNKDNQGEVKVNENINNDDDDDGIGNHLLNPKFYLETEDRFMGNLNKGESYVFLFPDASDKKRLKYHFKWLAQGEDSSLNTRKNIIMYLEMCALMYIVISPLFIEDYGVNTAINFIISLAVNSLLLLRVNFFFL